MAPAVVTPYDNDGNIAELQVITSSAEINGSLFTDAIVQKNCSVHVRGSVTGSYSNNAREGFRQAQRKA